MYTGQAKIQYHFKSL